MSLILMTILAAVICAVNGRAKKETISDVIYFPDDVGDNEFDDGEEASCNAPNGVKGTCMDIYRCASLLALVRKPNRTPQDLDILKRSQCGFQGGNPVVCCTDGCQTPNGRKGQCVNIHSCKHITEMLKPPVSQQTMQFVQNSRCPSEDPYSVCCGPESPITPPPRPGSCSTTVSALPSGRECCGKDANLGNKIVGGTTTMIDEYPWLINIEYVQDGKTKLLCGGTLISGLYVLTAGHCVAGAVLEHGTPTNIRLGEYDTSNSGPDCVTVEAGGTDCSDDIVVIPIEQIIAHPEYNPVSPQRKNDIALIRMRRLAPYTDFIRPICLPTSDITIGASSTTSFFAAGWGAVSTRQSSSNIKLKVDLPFIANEVCQAAYAKQNRRLTIWDKQICAGGVAGKDSCKGDSGGPLMFEHDRRYEIAGVVSFGPTPCGLPDIPGVYTKVYNYMDWIRNTIRP